MLLSLSGTPRAADFNYRGSMALNMMETMWDFMQWFLGRRDPFNGVSSLPWRYDNPVASWYAPYGNGYGPSSWGDPYGYAPGNPWGNTQSLDGVWMSPSGEYWFVRGRQFVYRSGGESVPGEFELQGSFILTRMPWGEIEFEYRQMGDVLVLRDLDGRVTMMRRIEQGGWRW